jgi:hypothetical protein
MNHRKPGDSERLILIETDGGAKLFNREREVAGRQQRRT